MRKVLAPKWWLLHLFVVGAVYGMLRLGLWQWHRANSSSGGIQNYAYAFQWPLFALFGIVLWVKTMQDEVRGRPDGHPDIARRNVATSVEAPVIRTPGVRVGVSTTVEVDDEDDEVAAWNARLAALNARTAAADSRKG